MPVFAGFTNDPFGRFIYRIDRSLYFIFYLQDRKQYMLGVGKPVLALAVLAALCVAKDHFEDADLNSDGKIDRTEFATLGSKVKSALLTVLDEPKVSALHADRHAVVTAGLDMFPELHAFWPAFINSLMMIWATEIGDKTFFIAAILAMSNDRFVVFSGAVLALAVMTVLSSLMGFALPNLMPRTYTHYGAAVLFFYFGEKPSKAPVAPSDTICQLYRCEAFAGCVSNGLQCWAL